MADMKFKSVKKLETKYTKVSQPRKLSDDDLEGVAGGYYEDCGNANGYWIECPICHRNKASEFDTWMMNERDMDGYTCKCGYVFGVDSSGQYWDLREDTPI